MLLYRLWRRSVYKVFWTFRSWGYCNSDFVMSEKFPIAEYISLLYLGVLVLVISAFWFCLKVFGSISFLFENTVPMVLEFCRDRIWVSSRWNFALLPLACSGMLVCLFLPPGFSDAYAGGSCLLFEAYPGLFRSHSTFFWNFFHLFPSVFWWC